MNILNNLFGNTPFYGKKGKIKANDRYDLMHAGSANIHTNVYLYTRYN